MMQKIINKVLIVVSAVLITSIAGCTQGTEQPNTVPMQSSQVQSSTVGESKIENLAEAARYQTYTAEAFESSKDKKRVLFFHANWCPTCKKAHQEITSESSQIPEDVVIFKTDYDTETQLKKKYTITYQHTFVLVDAQGNEIKKWNGGGIAEVRANTQ